jgi:ribosomal protein S18 acetylase RimI-like enzyme
MLRTSLGDGERNPLRTPGRAARFPPLSGNRDRAVCGGGRVSGIVVGMGTQVRQARAGDWEELRELRLRALADAPDAFASTRGQEAAFAEEVWRRRAEGGPGSASFIASQDGTDTGMAAIFVEPNVPGRAHLVGMWVDPRHRRRGVASALIDQALRWAGERRAREMVLWVADHNTAARELYRRLGFRPTGERQPLPSNPALTESLLRLPLGR